MKTQEWYFDNKTKTIRSMKLKYILSISGNGGDRKAIQPRNMVVRQSVYQDNWYQLFKWDESQG
jgi:hypothetical protein